MLAFPNCEERQIEEIVEILEESVNRREEPNESKSDSSENWWEKIKKFETEKEEAQELRALTEKWMNYEITNFEYLMMLNMLAGRTNSDLNQYPIFPWVYSKYNETKFKKNEEKYRNFKKNMGAMGSE